MVSWVQLLRNLVRGDVEHYEKTYPLPDGEGTAGALISLSSNADNNTDVATTTQEYYGEPKRIVPPSVGGDFSINGWRLVGVVLHSDTTALDFKWELIRVVKATEAARNAGNAWSEGTLALTVATGLGANFQDQDLVWISSDEYPDGEIVRVNGAPAGDVVTIARETVNMTTPTGLRWNHATNPKMYLCRRAGGGYRRIHGWFSAASAKETIPQRFHSPRVFKADDGIIARIINTTNDADSNLDMGILYDRGTVWGE